MHRQPRSSRGQTDKGDEWCTYCHGRCDRYGPDDHRSVSYHCRNPSGQTYSGHCGGYGCPSPNLHFRGGILVLHVAILLPGVLGISDAGIGCQAQQVREVSGIQVTCVPAKCLGEVSGRKGPGVSGQQLRERTSQHTPYDQPASPPALHGEAEV